MKIQPLRHGDVIPEGAKYISEKEMAKIITDRIRKWEPKSQMYAITWGTGLLGGVAGLTGGLMNQYYRNKFRLRSLGRLSTFGPAVILPTLFSVITQNIAVFMPMALKKERCALCVEMRSMSAQVLTGFVQPVFLSILSSIIVSRNHYTVSFPRFTEYRQVFQTLGKMSKGVKNPAIALLSLNIAAACLITREQAKALARVHQKLSEGELFSK